jgi:hypothetical protein
MEITKRKHLWFISGNKCIFNFQANSIDYVPFSKKEFHFQRRNIVLFVMVQLDNYPLHSEFVDANQHQQKRKKKRELVLSSPSSLRDRDEDNSSLLH